MSKLQIVPLGGMGKVTQNMYLYIYDQEILIVDCGIGFPDLAMPGVDVLIPDISFLHKQLEEGKQIVGMILSHGHDDHIGALPYILPQLPDFEIYASPLTAGFAKNRIAESEVADKEIIPTQDRKEYALGKHFSFESFAMTHSVPDTKHLAISTPEGLIYHGTDFKLDPKPVDGILPDYDYIAQVGKRGVMCMLMDCLRVERKEWTKSESTTGPAIEASLQGTKGKYIVTLMSSHIHRIQQVVDIAVKNHRKVAFIGRSVEQNVEVALRLKKLTIPQGVMIDKRDIDDFGDEKLCLIVAGSQGQEGSSLVRAVYGEHPMIQIKENDRVVFSADAIPGNEIPYYQAIDELARNKIDVVYPTIAPDVHQSGHAATPEQQELLDMVKPKYVMPIGGQDRHRSLFVDYVAKPLGFKESQVLLPSHGQILEFAAQKPIMSKKISIKPIHVDGLGVGDVGPAVLSDRKTLGEAGMIILVIPRNGREYDLGKITVVSRGFVFMKEADEVISFIKKNVADIILELQKEGASEEKIKKAIEKRLSRRVNKVIRRTPMIMPVFIDID